MMYSAESIMNVLEEKLYVTLQHAWLLCRRSKRLGSPGRREVGHGNLAENALKATLPAKIVSIFHTYSFRNY